MQIKVLDRYIFKQIFWATLVCIFLFAIIWIAPEILLRTVQRVLDGSWTLHQGIFAILAEIPKVLGNALPIGIFLGTLFTFDKLSKDSEIYVLRSIGVPFFRIIASAMVLGLIISLMSFYVRSEMIPYASMHFGNGSHTGEKNHFVFPIKNSDNTINKVIIIPEYQDYNIKDVVVLNFSELPLAKGESLLKSIYISDYVKYEKNNDSKNDKWVINEATSYDIAKDGIYKKTSQINDVVILEGLKAENAYKLMQYSVKRERDLNNSELSNYIKLLKAESMDDEYRYMFNKYLQRYTHSIVALLFTIFGALLGFSRPREQRLIGFTLAVATIFIYYITMPFLDLLTEKGILYPIFTAFLPIFVLGLCIVIVLKHKDL